MLSPLQLYKQQIDSSSLLRDRLRSRLKVVPWIRLATFLLVIAFIILYTTTAHAGYLIAAGLSFIGFILAGWYDARLKRNIRKRETLIEINQREIDAIQGNYAVFEPGTEFIDHQHPYTHDLDVFGIGSLFQYINRTSTIFGKRRLADFFQSAG